MKTLFVFLFSAIFVCSSAFAVLTGLGTESDPYLIQSKADFDHWRVNWAYKTEGIYTKLETDIDLAGQVYDGYVVSGTFAGNFNGNGFKILNLSITNAHGFFTFVSGSVENLSIINCSLTTEYAVVGGLCKNLEQTGSISRCYFSGSISSTQNYVGGITGNNGGTITKSISHADVSGGGLYASTGAFVGGNFGQISDCYAQGSVTAQGWAGGFVGYNETTGSISSSYSIAKVTKIGTEGGYVDGFAGRVHGSIENCFLDITASQFATVNAGVTELDSEQMQVESNFTDAGWDFTNIWTMPDSGAPIFKWQADGRFCINPPFFDYNNDCLVTIADFAAFANSWLDCGYANQSLCPN